MGPVDILPEHSGLFLAQLLAAPDPTDVGRQPRAPKSTDWAASMMEREETGVKEGEIKWKEI